MAKSFAILGGNGCPELGQRVANLLGCEFNEGTTVSQFHNSETNVIIGSVRNKSTVYIIQSFGAKHVNDQFMELGLLANAIKTNGGRKTVVICPCFGYARQDRSKMGERKPVSSQFVSDIIQSKSVNIGSIYVIDIHCEQIQNAYNRALFQNLEVSPIFAKKVSDYIKKRFGNDSEICIVAPDHGATARNKAFKKHFEHYFGNETSFAVIDKERAEAGVVKDMMLTTDTPIDGRITIIVDDIADTCGTLCKAAEVIMARGAAAVIAVITHPVLSGEANARIEQSQFAAVFVSDSIPLPVNASNKFKVISIDSLIATIITNLENRTNRVLSDIYDVGVLDYLPNGMTSSQTNFHNLFKKSEANHRKLLKNQLANEKNLSNIFQIDNLHIGVLSGNEQKMKAIQDLNSTWILTNVMPNDYVPLTEQPIGHKMTRKCIMHRYNNCNRHKLWGLDIIIGIESGLLFNGKIGEITQVAVFTNTTYSFLKPHIIQSKKNIKHHVQSILDQYQVNPDEGINEDITETKDIMDILYGMQKDPKLGFTFGQWLHDKFGDDAKNWHSRFFDKDRDFLIHESLRNKLENQNDYDIIENACQLRGMLDTIEVYEDFPKEGVNFQNIYPLFRNPTTYKHIINKVVDLCRLYNIDTICAVSSRGYLVGPIVAMQMGIPLGPITKPGKLPETKVIIQEYQKEYGSDSLQIEKKSIKGTNVMIIDDVLATGGSLQCCFDLVTKSYATMENESPLIVRALTLSHVKELQSIASEKLKQFDSVSVIF